VRARTCVCVFARARARVRVCVRVRVRVRARKSTLVVCVRVYVCVCVCAHVSTLVELDMITTPYLGVCSRMELASAPDTASSTLGDCGSRL